MRKRSNRLAGLMDDALSAEAAHDHAAKSDKGPHAAETRTSGHFTKSLDHFDKSLAEQRAELEDLRRQTPREIKADQVSESRFSDRIAVEHDLDSLVDSIRANGQQLPILVRPTPSAPLPYEIVYGRRRLAACRVLGCPVKAIITEMDEAAAVLLQGVENAERLETSYIERASFAQQLREAGYSEAEISRVLGKDAPEISRMKSLMQTLPNGLVQALGPVRDGRRPFDALKSEIARSGLDGGQILGMVDRRLPLERRLGALTAAVRAAGPSRGPAKKAAVDHISKDVTATRIGNGLSLKTTSPEADFLDFVHARLADMYDQWKNGAR